MKKISEGSAKTKLFDKIKSFFVRKKYSFFNRKIFKKGVIDKEEYIYNKNHMKFIKNNVDEIKSLFTPLLEDKKSMKQFLFEVTKDKDWIKEKLWFKTNDHLLTISETSRNNSSMVRERINNYYEGDQNKFEQSLKRYRKEHEKN